MFCGKCGAKVSDSDKYCMNCGNKIYNDIEKKIDTDVYVSQYNASNTESYMCLIISIITIILSLLPINKIYMIVVIGISIAVTIVNILKYKKYKDKVLFISILLSIASIYTSLGWLYYLFVS